MRAFSFLMAFTFWFQAAYAENGLLIEAIESGRLSNVQAAYDILGNPQLDFEFHIGRDNLETPLGLASGRCYDAIVNFLLDKGATPSFGIRTKRISGKNQILSMPLFNYLKCATDSESPIRFETIDRLLNIQNLRAYNDHFVRVLFKGYSYSSLITFPELVFRGVVASEKARSVNELVRSIEQKGLQFQDSSRFYFSQAIELEDLELFDFFFEKGWPKRFDFAKQLVGSPMFTDPTTWDLLVKYTEGSENSQQEAIDESLRLGGYQLFAYLADNNFQFNADPLRHVFAQLPASPEDFSMVIKFFADRKINPNESMNCGDRNGSSTHPRVLGCYINSNRERFSPSQDVEKDKAGEYPYPAFVIPALQSAFNVPLEVDIRGYYKAADLRKAFECTSQSYLQAEALFENHGIVFVEKNSSLLHILTEGLKDTRSYNTDEPHRYCSNAKLKFVELFTKAFTPPSDMELWRMSSLANTAIYHQDDFLWQQINTLINLGYKFPSPSRQSIASSSESIRWAIEKKILNSGNNFMFSELISLIEEESWSKYSDRFEKLLVLVREGANVGSIYELETLVAITAFSGTKSLDLLPLRYQSKSNIFSYIDSSEWERVYRVINDISFFNALLDRLMLLAPEAAIEKVDYGEICLPLEGVTPFKERGAVAVRNWAFSCINHSIFNRGSQSSQKYFEVIDAGIGDIRLGRSLSCHNTSVLGEMTELKGRNPEVLASYLDGFAKRGVGVGTQTCGQKPVHSFLRLLGDHEEGDSQKKIIAEKLLTDKSWNLTDFESGDRFLQWYSGRNYEVYLNEDFYLHVFSRDYTNATAAEDDTLYYTAARLGFSRLIEALYTNKVKTSIYDLNKMVRVLLDDGKTVESVESLLIEMHKSNVFSNYHENGSYKANLLVAFKPDFLPKRLMSLLPPTHEDLNVFIRKGMYNSTWRGKQAMITPLIYFSATENLEAVKALINYGADINQVIDGRSRGYETITLLDWHLMGEPASLDFLKELRALGAKRFSEIK